MALAESAAADRSSPADGTPVSLPPPSTPADSAAADRSSSADGPRPTAEERLWAQFKGIPIGPFRLELGASIRLRGEAQSNFNVRRFGDGVRDEILLERARLELGLRLDGLRLFVQGQDAHELGCDLSKADFPNGSPYDNRFDLRQAYLEWTRIGGSPVGFKAGRQSMAFTDNRLMGPGEWGNVGRYTWDAAALTWRSQLVNADVFYGFRVRHDPDRFDDQHFDYDVLGIFTTFPIGMLKLHAFYFLRMNNFPATGSPAAGSFFRHSPGVSLEGAFANGIDVSGGVVPQLGTWGRSSVQALGGYAVLGYTAPVFSAPRLGLHYAYASGDPDLADGTLRTFDGVLGAVDQYYGRMNLFAWMNLHDAQAALSLRPLGRIKIEADYHLFLLAEKRDSWYYATGASQRRDVSGASGRLLGHEVDVVVSARATAHARFLAGYGLFIPGQFARNTGPHELAHWGFVQGSYEL